MKFHNWVELCCIFLQIGCFFLDGESFETLRLFEDVNHSIFAMAAFIGTISLASTVVVAMHVSIYISIHVSH